MTSRSNHYHNIIAANLSTIDQNITAAAKLAGRSRGDIQLIAVSKNHPIDAVKAAHGLGLCHFGENKWQEAATKFSPPSLSLSSMVVPARLKASAPVLQKDGDRDHADGIADLRWQDDVTLHFIGRLQTNKVKKVTRLFHYIHSVDRDSLAQALAQDKQQWQEKKPFPQLLLEVNVGEEPQKGGVPPSDLHDFYRRCRQQYDLPIVGLMAILPPQLPAAPFFVFLKQQADMLGLKELSMGMSQDYGAAVELGATMVRLGAALFGARA